MIVKNAGYMWHRKYVNWFSGEELIGYSEVNDKRVNFANQAGIYALYDGNSKCVYVGQSGKGSYKGLYHRLKDHAIEDGLFCMWERFTWFGFYSSTMLYKGVNEKAKGNYDKEFPIKTDVNELMNVIESMIIQVQTPSLNMSSGCMTADKSREKIEWFYQMAEIEEQKAEFNRLKQICKSLK